MRKRKWSQYNKSLVQRGSITFWIDETFLKTSNFKESTKGRPKFKPAIILMGWVLKTAYHLTFRSLEGYFNSLLALLKVENTCPNYTLFCKRGREVAALLPCLSLRKPLEIVIDASGLKIYGEGEWKTLKHGREKRRRWIKVHVGVDPKSGECLSLSITSEKQADTSQFSTLIKAAPKSILRAYADGAYDTTDCRKLLFARGIEDIIPPRKTAKIRKEKELSHRNQSIKEITGLGGDYLLWKNLKGYGRRSLVETFFSRLKLLFGERLHCRNFTNQKLETIMRVYHLNKMAKASF